MAFFAWFDIDLPRALRQQLVEALQTLDLASLNAENIIQVPRERGVYQLYHHDELVYVGKANNLRSRLTQHSRKIAGRSNIEPGDMNFKCLWMSPNWITLAPEAQLVALYASQGTASWNGGGFGPHDPGAGREERNDPPAFFDQQFPIRSDWQCASITAGDWGVLPLLTRLKKDLPFLLRFQGASADYEGASVVVPGARMSATGLLRLICQALPPGWQATRFPSHMILYKKLRPFQYGTVIYPVASD
jgi:hypothetical protein